MTEILENEEAFTEYFYMFNNDQILSNSMQTTVQTLNPKTLNR